MVVFFFGCSRAAYTSHVYNFMVYRWLVCDFREEGGGDGKWRMRKRGHLYLTK